MSTLEEFGHLGIVSGFWSADVRNNLNQNFLFETLRISSIRMPILIAEDFAFEWFLAIPMKWRPLTDDPL